MLCDAGILPVPDVSALPAWRRVMLGLPLIMPALGAGRYCHLTRNLYRRRLISRLESPEAAAEFKAGFCFS